MGGGGGGGGVHLVDRGEGSRGTGRVVAQVGPRTPTKGEGAGPGCPPHFAQTGRGTGPSESPKGDLASMGIKKQEERTVSEAPPTRRAGPDQGPRPGPRPS